VFEFSIIVRTFVGKKKGDADHWAAGSTAGRETMEYWTIWLPWEPDKW
jgi:hypothetical protein